MNFKMMGRLIALILMVEAVFMVPPLGICVYDYDFNTAWSFAAGIGITLGAAWLLYFICRDAKKGFYAREGFVCVGLSWIAMSLFGCIPFYLSGTIPMFLDAFFEMASGFTTTGVSILPDLEGISRGILYWRSFSHWLGGMGVLVFLLAVLPVSGRNDGFTMHLLRAESPGPNVGKLVPRMRQTAAILYVLYVCLTVLNTVFLLLGKMSLFDSVCTAFSTAGTGGFGIRNDSMASYSPYIQNVCAVFMLLFGVNFSCYYLLLLKQFKNVLKDEELRMYLGIIAGSILLIVWNLRGVYDTFGESFRHAAFQVVSIITTTGFVTTDLDLWPGFSKSLLLCLMLIGSCAGSTGGGIKCGRVLLLLKSLGRNIRKLLHPNKIQAVRNNGQKVDEKILENTNAYLAAYVVIIVGSFLVISLDGFPSTANFSAVFSCFNNIGLELDAAESMRDYSSYSVLSKLVLIMDMFAGRLEIFPILILFSRSTWRYPK